VLPPVHIAGVGAVGNALAYLIANLELAYGYVVLIGIKMRGIGQDGAQTAEKPIGVSL
jgi:malate/lactate dehydrogenase